MKTHLRLSLENIKNVECLEEAFPLSKKNITEIAEVFLDAFKNTIDYEGEDLNDTITEIQHVFENGYGEYSEKYSSVIVSDGQIASALFVVKNEDNLFIPYIITRKHQQGKGYAKKLIKSCAHKAKSDGIKYIDLYVTKGNTKAEKLYSNLGFEKIED